MKKNKVNTDEKNIENKNIENKKIENKKIENKKTKNGKRKKGKVWKKILIVILLILIILAVYFIYNSIKIDGKVSLTGMLATAVGHDENTKKNLGEFQVLLLGVSTDQAGVTLTDTIIVASYNPNTQRAVLLSIPRDSYTGKNPKKATASQKINAIYNLTKDPQETLDAVNELTGLELKYYAIVETEALIELVDAVGPINYYVPMDMEYDDETQDLHIDLKEGMQEIDGEKAEQLLRFRKNNDGTSYPPEYGDNDIGRMRTQREFISAVISQTVTAGNITKLGEILDIANRNLITNLDFNAVKDYLPYAVEFSTENLQTAVLPGTTPDISSTNNVSIYLVDSEETEKLINELFYPDNAEDTMQNAENSNTTSNSQTNTSTNTSTNTGKVENTGANTNTNNLQKNQTSENTKTNTSDIKIEILNASGSNEKLQKATKILKDAGYNVTKTGETSTVATTIITNKKDIESDHIQNIKELLGVGNISNNRSKTSRIDIQIVLGRDFNN